MSAVSSGSYGTSTDAAMAETEAVASGLAVPDQPCGFHVPPPRRGMLPPPRLHPRSRSGNRHPGCVNRYPAARSFVASTCSALAIARAATSGPAGAKRLLHLLQADQPDLAGNVYRDRRRLRRSFQYRDDFEALEIVALNGGRSDFGRDLGAVGMQQAGPACNRGRPRLAAGARRSPPDGLAGAMLSTEGFPISPPAAWPSSPSSAGVGHLDDAGVGRRWPPVP